jgi:PAS domain-containing protein
MGVQLEATEVLLEAAVAAATGPGETRAEALNALPAAIYVTDADGHLTYYNRACVPLAGREPQPGSDRWCVTWKLFTIDGDPLPHDACPMATAIKEQRKIRGAQAFAERPDGTRIRFQPFPTPFFNDDGSLAGAVNMLIDVTDLHRVKELRTQAQRCRRLANSVLDRRTLDTLKGMAIEYDAEADRLSRLN